MQDRIGQQFGNYRLIRLLGHGGYAKVYLAEHIHLPDLQYAIKILNNYNLAEYQREAFLGEARAIANLQRLSSHIVQISDFGIQQDNSAPGNNIPYLVMEYASAGTLRDLYPPGTQMPLDRIVFYINQVAEALQYAHEQDPPVVHRDVKPENMLLRTLDHVLLSDFGIAITGNTGTLPSSPNASGVVGTAAYVAPERLKGHVRRASDQYSLGIVVYEWLSGMRPFNGTTHEICYQHLTSQPPPLHADHPHVSPEVEAVVMRALTKTPEERYPGVQAFAQALTKAESQGQLVASPLPIQISEDSTALFTNQPTHGLKASEPVLLVPGPANAAQGATPALQQPQPASQLPLFLPASSLTLEEKLHPSVPQSRPRAGTASLSTSGQLQAGLQDFFDFSSQFARDRRYRLFRNMGILLNILSTLALVLLTRTIWLLPAGLLYTSIFFALCVRAVHPVLAAFFGILMAFYWGWLGWLAGGTLALYIHASNRLFVALICGVLVLVISLFTHIRYVSEKNL